MRYISWNVNGLRAVVGKNFMEEFKKLDADAFWKGMGNVSLLSPETKLLALRVSRKVRSEDLPQVVARMESAVRAGFAILSGFISPGEVAVRDMLIGNREARFVHMLPSCMGVRHRPDSRYLEPLAQGRFLEIAEGNDEQEFNRGACLTLNDQIAAMALAGEGGTLYWQKDGPIFRKAEPGLRGTEPGLRGAEPSLRGAEPANQDRRGAEPGLRGTEPTNQDIRGAEPEIQDREPANQDRG